MVEKEPNSERCISPSVSSGCFAGPFWICATLVFAIAISGNLSNFLIHLGEKTYHYVPEFQKGR